MMEDAPSSEKPAWRAVAFTVRTTAELFFADGRKNEFSCASLRGDVSPRGYDDDERGAGERHEKETGGKQGKEGREP